MDKHFRVNGKKFPEEEKLLRREKAGKKIDWDRYDTTQIERILEGIK